MQPRWQAHTAVPALPMDGRVNVLLCTYRPRFRKASLVSKESLADSAFTIPHKAELVRRRLCHRHPGPRFWTMRAVMARVLISVIGALGSHARHAVTVIVMFPIIPCHLRQLA
jgi:hypothetical protein